MSDTDNGHDEQRPYIAALAPLLRRVRTDVTAVKKASGETAWTTQPLTRALVAKHLNGGPARGVSPIKAGSDVTLVALLDLDSHKGEAAWPEMVAAARTVLDTAVLFGLRGIPWRSSGGRGIHIYFLWDEPQDAYSVRAMLTDVLASCGFTNGTKGVRAGQIEVFPKQDEVPVGGFGNQFILPLAGKSVPLDPVLDFEPAAREFALSLSWPTSEPVLTRPREARALVVASAAQPAVPLAVVRSALHAIPNDGLNEHTPDYDTWRDILFAVHDATGGSEEGRELVIEWSARNPKFDQRFFESRVWPYIKARDGGRGKTWKTLAMHARQRGAWKEAEHEAEWFEDLDEIEGPLPVRQNPPANQPAQSGGGGAPPPVRIAQQVHIERHPKSGKAYATITNVLLVLHDPIVCGRRIAYDGFRDEIMWAPPGTDQWQTFTDADYVWLRRRLEAPDLRFESVGRELMRDAVDFAARENRFDSAQLWLRGLRWDGTPRVERFLIDCWSTSDTPYHRAVARYLWTALAGRVLVPGVKADMVPIAVGVKQGEGKSSGVAAMAPAPEFAANLRFDERDDDLARKMRGKLIAEFGELRGLHTRDIEAIKDFVTWTHEEWVPKFKEFATKFPRRLLFFGTTNHDELLSDDTGNRRWLPFYTPRVDVSRIARDREQLWAEAAAMFESHGVEWQEADRLGPAHTKLYEMSDAWDIQVGEWLDRPGHDDAPPPRRQPFVTTIQLLTEALGFETRQITRKDEMRAASVLRRLGFARERARVSGRLAWVFVPTVPTSETQVGTP